MSYPPPPGLKSTPSPHPSLPARPPPSGVPAASFKPAYSSAPPGVRSSNVSTPPAFSTGFQGFAPRSVAQTPASQASAAYPAYQQPAFQQQSYYDAPQESSYGGAPQIRNPFPLPGQPGAQGRYDSGVDPEMEAQIAQWQSAYVKDDSRPNSTNRPRYGESAGAATSANAAPLGRPDSTLNSQAVSSAASADTGVATVVTGKDGKTATVVRSGGGTSWQDSSLLEWDPAHFRIFVGNLAGEVTDESLLKAFSRWPSVVKARVVRDKRTTKSKGFGFVSFRDGDDFFQAAREMNGKYIGSHPVLIKRSTTEIKATVPKDDRRGKWKGKNNKGGNGGGGGGGGGGASTGAGVQKPGSKTKGGLRVLG